MLNLVSRSDLISLELLVKKTNLVIKDCLRSIRKVETSICKNGHGTCKVNDLEMIGICKTIGKAMYHY